MHNREKKSHKDKNSNNRNRPFIHIGLHEGREASKDNISRLMDLKLPISVELGRKQLLVKEILDLEPGDTIKLNRIADEPVDIFVDNKKFAEGEIIKVEGNYAVRITALVQPNDRLPNIKSEE